MGGDENDLDDPLFDIGPAGQQFANPVASGSQFLFGNALADSVGGNAQADQLLPDASGDPFGFGGGQ
jgi:hypothetical protein